MDKYMKYRYMEINLKKEINKGRCAESCEHKTDERIWQERCKT
jgi:hypothetical protein